MSSSTATNSSCSSSVVGPATSEDILSHVREEEEAHKLRLRAADRKLEALKARLRQVPQGFGSTSRNGWRSRRTWRSKRPLSKKSKGTTSSFFGTPGISWRPT